MNKTIFKQTDSRWSGLYYPRRGSSFGGNGCGCVSCVHIAIEQASKKSWTPATLRPWMVSKGFAVQNQGTTWNGITETLKYIGHKNVVKVWDSDPMSKAWAELNKGNRIGIILFNSRRAPNGIRWTSSGHYVAFTDYKLENGKHKFYCKDSGGRNHDGWYTYENSMKGCIPKLWIVERIKETAPTKKAYSGVFPNTNVEVSETIPNTTKIVSKARELAWAKGTAAKKYAYKGGAPTDKYKTAMNKAYPDRKSWGKAPKVGCACDVFVGTVVRASGLDADYPRGVSPLIDKYTSKSFEKIVKKNVTPYSVSRDGDIVAYYKDTAHKHAHTLIRGDGMIYEAQLEMTYPHVNTSLSKIKKKMPVVVIMRAKLTTKKSVRAYLKKGDRGVEVTKWQKYLNWYFGKKVLAEDGIFGDATDTYSKKFQKAVGLSADGLVGSITIGKAKAVKK